MPIDVLLYYEQLSGLNVFLYVAITVCNIIRMCA